VNDCESDRRSGVPYCTGDEIGGGGRNLMEHVATAILLNHREAALAETGILTSILVTLLLVLPQRFPLDS
jgi:hypothetical protein